MFDAPEHMWASDNALVCCEVEVLQLPETQEHNSKQNPQCRLAS